MKNNLIIELSRKLTPGKENLKLEARTYDVVEDFPDIKHNPDDWYVISEFTMSSHVGTHIEFPLHHVRGGMDAMGYPIERLIGEEL